MGVASVQEEEWGAGESEVTHWFGRWEIRADLNFIPKINYPWFIFGAIRFLFFYSFVISDSIQHIKNSSWTLGSFVRSCSS